MKIIDISKGMFSTKPYPGDPKAQLTWLTQVDEQSNYSLSQISFCSHNATHVDSPFHYIKKGLTIDKLPLSVFYGECEVCSIANFLSAVKRKSSRILIKGKFSCQLARLAVEIPNLLLVGTDEIFNS